MSLQSFEKGLKRDISRLDDTSDSLYYMYNGRLTTDGYQTNLTISNLIGNAKLDIEEDDFKRDSYRIVGHCLLREDIILFYCFNTSTNYESSIGKLCIIDMLKKTGEHSYKRYMLWKGFGLNLWVNMQLRIVARYESEIIQKIYWVDYNNPMRYLNISSKFGTTDDYSHIMNMTVSEFNITQEIKFSTPKIISIGSGKLRTGAIQYAYRLYVLNGAVTRYSQASPLVMITPSEECYGKSGAYMGGDIDVISGKSVTIEISEIDNKFDKIEIIALHHTSNNETCIIRTISIMDVSESRTVRVTDDGLVDLYSPIIEEYRSQPQIFSAKHLIDKDHILFPSNIKLYPFVLKDTLPNWDSRAFRFNSLSKCILSDSLDSESTYSNNQIGTIPLTHDCINKYNDITKEADINDPCIYMSDGRTLGAEGINVEISFSVLTIHADDDSDTRTIGTTDKDEKSIGFSDYASPINGGEYVGYKRGEVYAFAIVVIDEYGRESEAMWTCDLKMPNANDIDAEVKYNKYGVSPLYKLGEDLGDMKDFATSFYVNKLEAKLMEVYMREKKNINLKIKQGTYFNILRPNFRVKNLPNNYRFRIVRCQRTANDKTILAQGLLSSLMTTNNGENFGFYTHPSPTTNMFTLANGLSLTDKPMYKGVGENKGSFEYDTSSDLYEFITPCTNYKRIIKSKAEDFIKIAGFYGNSDNRYFDNPGKDLTKVYIYHTVDGKEDMQIVRKFRSCNPYLENTANGFKAHYKKEKVIQSLVTDSGESSLRAYISLAGEKINNYVHRHDVEAHKSHKGSTMLVALENSISKDCSYFPHAPESSMLQDELVKWLAVDYVRNTVQYGGNTYAARLSREYVPCSDVSDSNTVGYLTVYGGDTFINFFSYMRTIYTLKGETSVGHDGLNEILYIPLESDFNLNMQSSSFNFAKFNNMRQSFLLQERPGLYSESSSNSDAIILEQSEYYYKYNEVYSKWDTSSKYYPLDVNYKESTKFDTRIFASETKANGEELDNWTIFKPLSYIDVDNKFGEITNTVEYKNYIVVFQDTALGIAEINVKAFVNSTAGDVALGVGGKLTRLNYEAGSTIVGCSIKSDVVKSIDFLYWYDKNKRGLYIYDGGVKSYSDLKNNASWFIKNTKYETIMRGVYDRDNKEAVLSFYTLDETDSRKLPVCNSVGYLSKVTGISGITHKFVINVNNLTLNAMSFINISYSRFQIICSTNNTLFLFNSTTDLIDGEYDVMNYINNLVNFTVIINELLQEFVGFAPFIPLRYIKTNNGFISSPENINLWKHDIGLRGNFYGKYHETVFDVWCNGKDFRSKKFLGVELMVEVSQDYKTYSGTLETDSQDNIISYDNNQGADMIGLENETLSSIQSFSNDQIGDEVILYPEVITTGRGVDSVDKFRHLDIIDANDYAIRSVAANPGIYYNGEIHRHIYNIKRASNKWRTAIPRSYVGRNYSDSDKKVYEHIRSPFCRLRFRYVNKDNKKLTVYPINVIYDIQQNEQ